MREIYLDYQSATPPLKSSLQEGLLCQQRYFGSPFSSHNKGQEALPLERRYTQSILSSLGANPSDHFYPFMSSTDAIDHLLLSYYLEEIKESGRHHLLALCTQDSFLSSPLKKMEALGCHIKRLPVDRHGQLTEQVLRDALSPRTALVSFSLADSATGMLQPIDMIARICQQENIPLHLDVSTALGKIPISFTDWGLTFLTFEGSLAFSPKGTAGLLIRDKALPLLQVHPSLPTLASLAKALEEVISKMESVQLETASLLLTLEEGILRSYPQAQVLFPHSGRLPHVTTIAFPGIHSDALLFLLNQKKVYASSGGGAWQRLAHLLPLCGIDPVVAHTAITFSLSFETTQEEIDIALQAIKECIETLLPLSCGGYPS